MQQETNAKPTAFESLTPGELAAYEEAKKLIAQTFAVDSAQLQLDGISVGEDWNEIAAQSAQTVVTTGLKIAENPRVFHGFFAYVGETSPYKKLLLSLPDAKLIKNTP